MHAIFQYRADDKKHAAIALLVCSWPLLACLEAARESHGDSRHRSVRGRHRKVRGHRHAESCVGTAQAHIGEGTWANRGGHMGAMGHGIGQVGGPVAYSPTPTIKTRWRGWHNAVVTVPRHMGGHLGTQKVASRGDRPTFSLRRQGKSARLRLGLVARCFSSQPASQGGSPGLPLLHAICCSTGTCLQQLSV